MRPVDYEEAQYGNYDELLASMEYPQLFSQSFGEYSGDTVTVFQDGQRYGMLTFGWGSCSGCDALQACINEAEVTSLRDELHSSIHWFDSLDALKAYVADADTRNEWYLTEVDWREAAAAIQALSSEPPQQTAGEHFSDQWLRDGDPPESSPPKLSK